MVSDRVTCGQARASPGLANPSPHHGATTNLSGFLFCRNQQSQLQKILTS